MRTRQFVNRHRISIRCEWVDSNPNMSEKFEGTHYKVTLRRDRPHRQLTTYFSMGYAHTEEPSAADVLYCLASDASGADQSFEDWTDDYGYDPDSRKAERTYKAVVKQSKALRRFLGEELLEELLQADR